jgi:hypothetical protein
MLAPEPIRRHSNGVTCPALLPGDLCFNHQVTIQRSRGIFPPKAAITGKALNTDEFFPEAAWG